MHRLLRSNAFYHYKEGSKNCGAECEISIPLTEMHVWVCVRVCKLSGPSFIILGSAGETEKVLEAMQLTTKSAIS